MGSRKIEVEIVGDSASLQRAFSRSATAASQFDGRMSGTAKGLRVAGLAAASFGALAAGGMAVAGKKMIEMASNAAEVDSKFKTIFGSTVPGINREIARFSEVTGASSFAMREQVADMGALLKPLLGNTQAAAGMSVQFTKLAADLGSFNNVPTADALLAIRSGLVGEAEPLRRFGVLLNEAAVKAEAYRMGLAKSGAELTEQQKVQARASLIMQQTSIAQGDAARTAGSMANQIKALRNNVSDAATSIGASLIPGALALVRALNTKVIPGIKEFAAQISDAKGFHAKVSVIWDGLKEAASALYDKLNAALFGSTRKVVLNASQSFEVKTDGLFDKINWEAVGKGFLGGLKSALQKADDISQVVIDTLAKVNWEKVGTTVGPAIAAGLVAGLATLVDPAFWTRHWQELAAIALALIPVGRLASLGLKVVEVIAAPVTRLLGPLLGEAISAATLLVIRISERLPGRLEGIFVRAVDLSVAVFKQIVVKIGEEAGKLPGWVAGKLGSFKTFVIKALAFDAIIHAAVAGGKAIVEGVVTGLSALVGSVIDSFRKVWGYIKDAAGSAYAYAFRVGSQIVSGILGGLGNLVGSLKNAIGGALGSALGSIDVPGWSPPHHAAAQAIGVPLGQGAIAGWILGSAQLPSKMSDTLRNALESARTAISNSRSVLSGAWSQLTQDALAAFDAATARMMSRLDSKRAQLTASEKALADLQSSHDEAGRQKAITDAQGGLATAQASGDQSAIVAAQQALDDALYSEQVAALQRKADAERAARDKLYADKALNLGAQRDLERRHFEARLVELEQQLEREGATHRRAQARIIALLHAFGVSYKQAGNDLGDAFARGLDESAGAVEKSAARLAKIVEKYLKTHSPSELGPMSDLDTWWKGMAPSLISGLDVGAISGTVSTAATPSGFGSSRTGAGAAAPVFNFYGHVWDKNQLISEIRNGLAQTGRLNVDMFGGLA